LLGSALAAGVVVFGLGVGGLVHGFRNTTTIAFVLIGSAFVQVLLAVPVLAAVVRAHRRA
jgi:hypothetical protein